MIKLHSYLAIIFTALMLTSCGTSGRVVNADGVVFSEYYQCLIYAESRDYSFDVLWTLGKERLPKGHVFSESDAKYLKAPDTIEEVLEIYIRNHSDQPIQVTLQELGSGRGNSSVKYRDAIYEVMPEKWAKSEPKIRATSIYGPDTVPCWIRFDVGGVEQTLSGTKRRLTLEELSR